MSARTRRWSCPIVLALALLASESPRPAQPASSGPTLSPTASQQDARLGRELAEVGRWEGPRGSIEVAPDGRIVVDMDLCDTAVRGGEPVAVSALTCPHVRQEGAALRPRRPFSIGLQLTEPRMPWLFGAYLDGAGRLHVGQRTGPDVTGVAAIRPDGSAEYRYTAMHTLFIDADGTCRFEDRLRHVPVHDTPCHREQAEGVTWLRFEVTRGNWAGTHGALALEADGAIWVTPGVRAAVFERAAAD